ncbi:MAG TPA: septum formation initiator family protein [Vicinamibacterales bacterium]|nr:septum formation initiator family protein [Vicinamibacterales bacterium]
MYFLSVSGTFPLDVHATHIYSRELPSWPVVPRRRAHRFWSQLLLFAASVLLVNGLIGERGWLATARARRAYAAAAQELAQLRHDNQALRERARQLRSDPRAIEAVARGELGLAAAHEIVVTVRTVTPGAR